MKFNMIYPLGQNFALMMVLTRCNLIALDQRSHSALSTEIKHEQLKLHISSFLFRNPASRVGELRWRWNFSFVPTHAHPEYFLIAPVFSRIGAERPSVTLQVVKKTQRLKTFTNTIAGVRQRERENVSDNFSCCNGLFRSRSSRKVSFFTTSIYGVFWWERVLQLFAN